MPLSEERSKAGSAPPPDKAGASREDVRCTACNGGKLARENVKTALWNNDRLVVVENIPALVCQACGEQFYEDETAMVLDIMRGKGFPEDQATGRISVPVFRFETDGGDDAT